MLVKEGREVVKRRRREEKKILCKEEKVAQFSCWIQPLGKQFALLRGRWS